MRTYRYYRLGTASGKVNGPLFCTTSDNDLLVNNLRQQGLTLTLAFIVNRPMQAYQITEAAQYVLRVPVGADPEHEFTMLDGDGRDECFDAVTDREIVPIHEMCEMCGQWGTNDVDGMYCSRKCREDAAEEDRAVAGFLRPALFDRRQIVAGFQRPARKFSKEGGEA